MSGFLYRLGRACYIHHWRTILTWFVVMVVSGGLYAGFHGEFQNDFKLPGAQSMVAMDRLNQTFPQMAGVTAQLVVVAPDGKRIDDPSVKPVVTAAVAQLTEHPFVSAAVDPYNPILKGAISADGTTGMATVQLKGTVSEITDAQRAELSADAAHLQTELPGSTVRMGGQAYGVSMPGVSVVEAMGVVVALIVLFFTLGSALAAGIPIVTALVGVGISTLLMMASTKLIDILSASPMLSLMLGLAVGIDYALFILSRHRDQLATGLAPEESTARAVATSGSAVVFAGTTVIIALLGLFVCGIPFLTIMGVFAAIAVAIAVLVALTLLPALMGLMGARLTPQLSRRQRRIQAAGGDPLAASDKSIWARWVNLATKAPVITVVVIVAALGALAIPAKDMVLALPNAGQHARTAPERQTYDLVADRFGPGFNGPLLITVSLLQTQDPVGLVNQIKADVEQVPGVALVPLATPNQTADTGIVEIIPTTAPDDPRTTDLVKDLRARLPGWEHDTGADLAVTGITAVQIDVTDQLGAALAPFALFVVGLSIVLLTMVFRSLFVPITAALGYLLSVGAAFGATTLVFNHGYGRQIINLADPVTIISFFPIIFMGILFGLAMDYQVFLVSRMREDHVHGVPAREAVKTGFRHSAKVVAAAGVIMFAVFAFFVPEGDATLKPIAFGLAFGIAVDAFVVRMTLIPAVMMLAGERAWWLPGWLERILPSFDVEGEGLAHQLSLADWPTPGDPHLIYADAVEVRDGATTLLGPTTLAALPGEAVIVTGEAPARAALLLALAGKLGIDGGEAKVDHALLSTQGAEVRGGVVYVDAHTPAPAREVGRHRPVVLIDDADLVLADHPGVREQLRDRSGRVLVLATGHPEALRDLVPDAREVRVGRTGNAPRREPAPAPAATAPAATAPQPGHAASPVSASFAPPQRSAGLSQLTQMFDEQNGSREGENR